MERKIDLFEQLTRKDTPKAINLQQFASEYAHQLPQQIQVIKGVYGVDEESTISCEDKYCVHFVLHREVVRVEDRHSSEIFSIPLNSSIKFGLLYDPNKSEKEALRGFVFPKVADILKKGQNNFPLVVCTMRDCESTSTDTCLRKGEVLLLRNAITTDSGHKLNVFSFSNHMEKCIDENTSGHFSTKPFYVRLYLTDILRHEEIRKSIPAAVVPFPKSQVTFDKLHTNQVLHMTRRFTDTLLIVTSKFDDTNIEESEPFEIPTELDIEVSVIGLTEKERLKLQVDNEYLKGQLGCKNVKHYRYVNVSDSAYQTQGQIYNSIRFGDGSSGSDENEEGEGEEWGYEGPPEGRPGEGGQHRSPDYSRPDEGNRLSIKQRLNLLEKRAERTEAGITAMKPELLTLATTTGTIQKDQADTEAAIRKDRQLFQTALAQIEQLRNKLRSLETTLQLTPDKNEPATGPKEATSTTSWIPSTTSHSLETLERNKQLLASLDVNQVTCIKHTLNPRHLHECM